jgi:hypothetical protein
MLNTNDVDPFQNIASDYLTSCFIDLNAKVEFAVEKLKPDAGRFDAIVVRGVSGLLVGPMVASRLGKPWCIVRKPGDGTHSDHKVVEGWYNFKSYIIVDDLIATGGTIKLIQKTLHEHGKAYREEWQLGVPECVGYYLFNHDELVWRGDGKNYSFHDKYFLFQEIPARPSVSEQIFAAASSRPLLAETNP